jgi:hypothetical protein
MAWLKQLAGLDAKEVIKLLLLFGTIFAGCQINRSEIKEVDATMDATFEDVAVLQDSITMLNRRVAALEKSPQRKVRRVIKQKSGFFSRLIPFFGG